MTIVTRMTKRDWNIIEMMQLVLAISRLDWFSKIQRERNTISPNESLAAIITIILITINHEGEGIAIKRRKAVENKREGDAGMIR